MGEYTNECALAELDNGTVVMNTRSYIGTKTNHRGIAWSDDGGETLSKTFLAPSLPDPICEGAMTTDASGKMLLFTHPHSGYPQRDDMSLFTSIDGGVSWSLAVQLDTGYNTYSSIIRLPNGSYAVEWDYGHTHLHRCNNGHDHNDCGDMFAIISFENQTASSSSTVVV